MCTDVGCPPVRRTTDTIATNAREITLCVYSLSLSLCLYTVVHIMTITQEKGATQKHKVCSSPSYCQSPIHIGQGVWEVNTRWDAMVLLKGDVKLKKAENYPGNINVIVRFLAELHEFLLSDC